MGVCNNGRFAKHITHDQIGAFSSHSGKLQQSIKILRHLTAVLIPQHLHTGADVSGLTLSQTAGPDDFLNFFHRCLRQGIHIRKLFIECRNHLIDPLIGALGRQTHAH